MIEVFAKIFFCFLIVVEYLILECQGRMVFLYLGYPRCHHHGKSGNRAKHHYKTHWNWIQRYLWVPILKEKYEVKWRILVILSYLHFFITIVCCCFAIKFKTGYLPWINNLGFSLIYFCVRFIYQANVGRKF